MSPVLRRARRGAGAVRRWLFPSPEVAALRRAVRHTERAPRMTPGSIRMMGYTLRYADLMSVCPQWEDIFIRRTLEFAAHVDAPRILDCGANIGLASLFFKRRHPRARIRAFEADPAIHAMLADNLRANGAADVDAVHAAIWTSNGSLTFRCEGADSGMIDSLNGSVAGPLHTVPSVRLRDLLSEPIDLLKLDIEGAESAVLRDCEPMLRHVQAMVLDLHEFDVARREAPPVLELLTRAGFEYAIDNLVTLPWRSASAPDTAFPGRALSWAMAVHAWRRA